MNSNSDNVTYEFWIFRPRGETYAVRRVGPEVTGIYGPLDYREVHFSDLPGFNYEGQPVALAWVNGNIDDFVLCEAECDEEVIWV